MFQNKLENIKKLQILTSVRFCGFCLGLPNEDFEDVMISGKVTKMGCGFVTGFTVGQLSAIGTTSSTFRFLGTRHPISFGVTNQITYKIFRYWEWLWLVIWYI